MHYARRLALVLFAVSASMSAQSDSASAGNGSKNVKITGTALYGYAYTWGDFNINGQGLHLSQALPDGPSFFGSCKVGADCTLSFTPPSRWPYCGLCSDLYSSGAVGGVHAP